MNYTNMTANRTKGLKIEIDLMRTVAQMSLIYDSREACFRLNQHYVDRRLAGVSYVEQIDGGMDTDTTTPWPAALDKMAQGIARSLTRRRSWVPRAVDRAQIKHAVADILYDAEDRLFSATLPTAAGMNTEATSHYFLIVDADGRARSEFSFLSAWDGDEDE
jgi:hypothetical protein